MYGYLEVGSTTIFGLSLKNIGQYNDNQSLEDGCRTKFKTVVDTKYISGNGQCKQFTV